MANLLRSTAAVAALALACGGGEEAPPPVERQPLSGAQAADAGGPNQPPVIESLALSSNDPVPGVELEARFDASDANHDPLTFQVTWLRNGRVELAGAARSWLPQVAEKGDRIEVRVIASDGQSESQPATASATVPNRPPQIAHVALEPSQEPTRGEPLVATPRASDPDGDELELRFEWLVNGRPARSEGPRLDTSDLQRGDRVKVRVIASDGEDESQTAESAELAIANSPPRFAKFDGFEIAQGMFRHQFVAMDPDGDGRLRFRIAEGPRGIEIDPVLGIATWQPDADTSGVVPVQVEVSDSFGATSALRFEITIARREEQKPAANAD